MRVKRYIKYAAVSLGLGTVCSIIALIFMDIHFEDQLEPRLSYEGARDAAERIERDRDVGKKRVYLYFAERDNNYLSAEERGVARTDDPVEQAKIIINALITGPRSSLIRTLPKETNLRALYIAKDNTAYIDFEESIRKMQGGVQSEYHAIYSIVNSLVLNISSIKRVKILVNGREAETLSGHIDLRNAFTADMLIVR